MGQKATVPQRAMPARGEGAPRDRPEIKTWLLTEDRVIINILVPYSHAVGEARIACGRTAGGQMCIIILDFATGEAIKSLMFPVSAPQGGGTTLAAVEYPGGGASLLVGHQDGSIGCWDGTTLEPLPDWPSENTAAVTCLYVYDEPLERWPRVVVGHADGAVRVLDGESGALLYTLKGLGAEVSGRTGVSFFVIIVVCYHAPRVS
jgi:WD40 repeat protein